MNPQSVDKCCKLRDSFPRVNVINLVCPAQVRQLIFLLAAELLLHSLFLGRKHHWFLAYLVLGLSLHLRFYKKKDNKPFFLKNSFKIKLQTLFIRQPTSSQTQRQSALALFSFFSRNCSSRSVRNSCLPAS